MRQYFPTAIIAGLCIIMLTACASPSPSLPGLAIHGPRFVLELSPGAYYRSTTTWFIFQLPIFPQLAAWVESTDGKYLGTIFVTAKAEKNSWISAPDTGRPEALPVWNHLKQGQLDAVAGATAEGQTVRDSDLAASLVPGDYTIKLETNRSYDYNDYYTVQNAGVSGQPSLIYQANLHVGAEPSSEVFTLIGHGSPDGSDGLIYSDLEGISTARQLFSAMTIGYRGQ